MELIAEIGQYHEGSFGRLWHLVEALCDQPVDTVKLQHHIADAESSDHEVFRKKFSRFDKSRKAYWKRVELPIDLIAEVKAYVESKGKRFLCSPFSLKAVDDLLEIGVDRIKVGSADVTNGIMLQRIADAKIPTLISNGLRDPFALSRAVELLSRGNDEITICHCTTQYPTLLSDVNFHEVDRIKASYPNCEVGLSDHTGSIWPVIYAAATNIDVCEIHVAFSRNDFGPDTSSSILITELPIIHEAISSFREISEPRSTDLINTLQTTASAFSRSAKLRKNIAKGEVLTLDAVESFKPAGHGIDPWSALDIIGLVARHDLRAESPLRREDFE